MTIRTLVGMLVLMLILIFPGIPTVNWAVDVALASQHVSGKPAEFIVRLIQFVYVVGSIIGIPALAIYMIRNQ